MGYGEAVKALKDAQEAMAAYVGPNASGAVYALTQPLEELLKERALKDVPHRLVVAVKEHAKAHYADGGWDVVVECWSDAEIAALLAETEAETIEEALGAFASLIDVWSDRQADAEYHRSQA